MPWNPVNASLAKPRGRRSMFIVGILIGLLAMPVAVWASHQFSDVPDSSPYHKNITALADSGVAGGYGDGTYKPTEVVSRQHMAAFLHRGLGRISALGVVGSIASAANDVEIASLDFRAEGAIGGYQGVLVTYTGQLDHDTSVAGGCTVVIALVRAGTTLDTWTFEFYPTLAGEESSATATWITTQPTQTLATYKLLADSSCSVTTYTDKDTLTIQNFPFEGDGTGFSGASVVKGEKPRNEP